VALFDGAAFLQNDDPGGAPHHRQAVTDDEGGTIPHQAFQRLLDHPLGLRLHGGGRFVQDEDFGIGQEGAGDADSSRSYSRPLVSYV
jgi:hypothetical protein